MMNLSTTMHHKHIGALAIFTKKLFLFAFSIFCTAHTVMAQWSVTLDRANAMYEVGQTAYFTFQSTYYGGPVEYQFVYDDYATPLGSGKINLVAGQIVKVPFTATSPGVVICRAKLYDAPATAAAAFSPFTLQPSEPAPTDFDAFWQNQKNKLQTLPFDPQLSLHSASNYSTTYRFNIASIDNRRVYGLLSIPKGTGPFPALINLPAFGNANAAGSQAVYAEQNGMIILSLSVHNAPPDQDDPSAYLPNDIYKPEGVYYRYPILGTIRAIDYLFSRADFDKTNLGISGASQGGGLSMMVAGIDSRVKAVAESNAALCDHLGLKYNRASGFPYYLNKARIQKGDENAAANAVKYYDAVYAAQRFKGSSLHVIGYEDEICPPSGIFVAYNQFKGPKVLVHALKLGHTHPNEFWEGRFDFFRKVFPNMRTVNPWPNPSVETGYFANIIKSNDNTNAVSLLGKIEKDERENSALPVNWRMVSGNGTTTFAPTNSRTTKASFSQSGAYSVAFSATDYSLLNVTQRYYTIENTINVTANVGTNPTIPTNPTPVPKPIEPKPIIPQPTAPNNNAPNVAYCKGYGIFPWHEWITDVAFFDGQKTSEKAGYSDFTKDVITTIARGQVKQMLLGAAYSWQTHDEYWRIWIDYNKDGKFGADEIAYETDLPRPANGVSKVMLWAEMNIPKDIPVGETRMRVAMQRDRFPSDACTAVDYGEVEDYTVRIADVAVRNDNPSGELLYFGADAQANQVNLSWLLRTARNPQSIGVEKSLDNKNFAVLTEEPLDVYDKNSLIKGSVTDNATEKKAQYYRLRVTLSDSSVIYSPIKKANIMLDNKFTIFPNPTSEVLNVNLADYIDKSMLVQVYDATGKAVHQQQVDKITQAIFSIPLSGYEIGNYFLSITIEGKGAQVRKFVIDKQ